MNTPETNPTWSRDSLGQIAISNEQRLQFTVQLCCALLTGKAGNYLSYNGDFWEFRTEEVEAYYGHGTPAESVVAVVSDAQCLLRQIEKEILADEQISNQGQESENQN